MSDGVGQGGRGLCACQFSYSYDLPGDVQWDDRSDAKVKPSDRWYSGAFDKLEVAFLRTERIFETRALDSPFQPFEVLVECPEAPTEAVLLKTLFGKRLRPSSKRRNAGLLSVTLLPEIKKHPALIIQPLRLLGRGSAPTRDQEWWDRLESLVASLSQDLGLAPETGRSRCSSFLKPVGRPQDSQEVAKDRPSLKA